MYLLITWHWFALEKQSLPRTSEKYYLFLMCVCSLSNPANRMRHIILSPMTCLAVPYFSTLTHDQHNFRNTVTEHKRCVLIISRIFSLKRLSFKEEFREIVINVRYVDLRTKCALFLSCFHETWIFRTDFRKVLKYQNQLKSLQWEPICSMRTEGQTNTADLTVAFRSAVKTTKRFLEAMWGVLINQLLTEYIAK
jgi:hypothetical protein